MKAIVDWIMTNWSYVLATFAGLVLVASAIVKMTKTTKDNEILRGIIAVLDKISIFKTKEDIELIERAKKILEEEPNK